MSQPLRMLASRLTSQSSISVTCSSPNLTRVFLNRPAKMNALNLEMVRSLGPVVLALPPKSCLLLEGSGDRAFCAGGDVALIREEVIQGNFHTLPADFFFEEYHLNYMLATLYKQREIVQVSLWNGVVMGGGVGISIHGPIRVATEKTLFAMPEVGIGFFPDVGTTHVLPRLKAGKEVGLYLALTGARMGPRDLVWSGVATHFVPSNQLPALVNALSNGGASLSEIELELKKARGEADIPLPTKGGRRVEQVFESPEFRQCFNQDSIEHVLESLEKLNTEDAKQALQMIRSASPLSVKLTFEALKRHGTASLEEVFQNEYRLSQHFMPDSDFVEGVRAVLVERNKPPKWRFEKIELVEGTFESFCRPLSSTHPRGEMKCEISKVFNSSL